MLNLRRTLRRHRSDSRGFAELLPWMILLTPALVLNKDGSLLALYEVGLVRSSSPSAITP